jgi:hypothetical protein
MMVGQEIWRALLGGIPWRKKASWSYIALMRVRSQCSKEIAAIGAYYTMKACGSIGAFL